MGLLNLEFDDADLQRVIADLQATESQAQKALRSTLGKMAAWVRTRSLRGLSKTLQIQQKEIRRRLKSLRLQQRGDGYQVAVWYGLDPIGMIHLGARQTSKGVKASGGRFVKSAFISKAKNGNKQVFVREGAARLPIKKQSAEIQDQAQTYLEDSVISSPEFEAQFYKVFERELKWRTQTQK